MSSLFENTCGIEDPKEIYDSMDRNYPGSPRSQSTKLWKLRRRCGMSSHNPSSETLLERAVANLANCGHMPGWFNQCPAAPGLVDPYIDNSRCVDLIHWYEPRKSARFVELKWKSNDPPYALRQILRYSIAYIFCLVHKEDLPLTGRPLMEARSVELEVVAPRRFYSGHDEKERFARVNNALSEFVHSKTEGKLSMSLSALAFPKSFVEVPFEEGKDVKEKCSTEELTDEGRVVRDAFAGLAPVWPL